EGQHNYKLSEQLLTRRLAAAMQCSCSSLGNPCRKCRASVCTKRCLGVRRLCYASCKSLHLNYPTQGGPLSWLLSNGAVSCNSLLQPEQGVPRNCCSAGCYQRKRRHRVPGRRCESFWIRGARLLPLTAISLDLSWSIWAAPSTEASMTRAQNYPTRMDLEKMLSKKSVGLQSPSSGTRVAILSPDIIG